MPIPQHYIHVYQRPKQGTNFIRRYPVANYQHTISNQGWFDTASGDIAVQSEAEGQRILEQYLGCFVAVYVDNPAQPIWEGLINRMTFNSGGASYTISMDEMANRVSVVYNSAGNAATQSAVVNNTTSQAIYGIKQEQLELGADPSASTQKTKFRDTILAQRAFPQSSCSQAGGNSNLVHFELIGMFHTLEWEKSFTAAAVVGTVANTTISNLLSGLANTNTFFDNTNLTQISTNAMSVPDQQRGVAVWDRIMKIAESGDGSNYWVAGITPTNKNTGKRILYYRIANTSIDYRARQSDGLKPRDQFGQLIKPWLVAPDVGMRITDLLVGQSNNLLTDNNALYIQSIQYNANTQSVQWFGADDTTARAAFLLKRGFKPLGKAFGAPLRPFTT